MSTLAVKINFIENQINRYVGLFIWVAGIAGNIMVILALTSTKQFRSHTYSVFMIATSIINTFFLVHYLGLSIVTTFLDFYPRATFTTWCKVYAYTYYITVYTSITLLAVATIDRWLSTSKKLRLRYYSSIRNARIAIGCVLLFFSLLLIPHPIYSEILFDPTRNSTKCDRPEGIYQKYVNYGLVILVHALSVIVMIVFGFLTYRQLATGVHGQIGNGVTIRQRINTQMTRTLFIQIILFIICIIPNWSVTILYPAFTGEITQRSAERMAIESLVTSLSTLLYNGNFADAFYIFFIVSSAFRRNVKLLGQCQHHNNRVAPHLLPIRH